MNQQEQFTWIMGEPFNETACRALVAQTLPKLPAKATRIVQRALSTPDLPELTEEERRILIPYFVVGVANWSATSHKRLPTTA